MREEGGGAVTHDAWCRGGWLVFVNKQDKGVYKPRGDLPDG